MDGIDAIEITSYAYDTAEAMAPPEEPQITETQEETSQITLLQPGEPIGFGTIKFKPIDGYVARRLALPTTLMQSMGHYNPIRTYSLYTLTWMQKGVGSIIDLLG